MNLTALLKVLLEISSNRYSPLRFIRQLNEEIIFNQS